VWLHVACRWDLPAYDPINLTAIRLTVWILGLVHRSIVIKAPCYKPEGRWSETRWGEWFFFFSIYLILPAVLGPGVYSASNSNEYQKQKNNVDGTNVHIDITVISEASFFFGYNTIARERGSIVAKAEAGRSRVRDTMRWMNFSSIYVTLTTQPLTEMSTRSSKIMCLGSRARPVRRADNRIAICEPTV
jgi:hypothetical protein